MPRDAYRIGDSRNFKEEEEKGFLSEFTSGFSSGVDTTMGTLGGVAALFNTVTGDEEEAIEYLNYASQKFQDASESTGSVQSIEEIEGAEDFVRWALYSAGTIVPSIATSVVGGGVGGYLGKKVAEKAVKDKIKKEVYDKVQDDVSEAAKKRMYRETLAGATQPYRGFGQAAGAFTASAAQNTGSTYLDIYEETGIEAPDVALAAGVASGALDAITPFVILRRIMPPTVFTKFKDKLSDRIVENGGVIRRSMLEATKQAGFEGFTEATQELIQATAVGMMRNDPTGGFAEYADEFVRNLENLEADEQLRSRLLNAAAVGAIGGTFTGGVSGVFKGEKRRVEDARKGKEQETEADKPSEEQQSEDSEEAQIQAIIREFDGRIDRKAARRILVERQTNQETARQELGEEQEAAEQQAPFSPLDQAPEEESLALEATRQRQRVAREQAQGLGGEPRRRGVTVDEQRARVYEEELNESMGRVLRGRRVLNEIVPVSLYEGTTTPEENALAAQEAERITVLPSGPTIELGPNRTMDELAGVARVDAQGNTTISGQTVDYQGIQGTLKKRDDGVFVVVTPEGDEVVVESGESQAGSTAAALLGVRPVDINVDTPAPDIQFNQEDQTFISRGKKYRYIETRYNDDGQPVAIDAETMDGQPRVFRSKRTLRAMEAERAKIQQSEMTQNLATGPAQFDDLSETLQMAVFDQRETQGVDTATDSVTREEIEAAVESAPASIQASLRRETEALFARDTETEFDIRQTFKDEDQWLSFEGDVVNANQETLEARQERLDLLSGQPNKPANSDDLITIKGVEGVAEKVGNAMRRKAFFKLEVDGQETNLEVTPADNISEIDSSVDSASATNEIQQAIFDLIEAGLPTEFVDDIQAIAVHLAKDMDALGATANDRMSLDSAMVSKSLVDPDSDRELRYVLAHEAWHVIDNKADVSGTLPSFNVEITFGAEGPKIVLGDALADLYDNYLQGTELGRRFTYPFNEIEQRLSTEADPAKLESIVESVKNFIKKETFAQLGAVYVSNPRLLKQQAPEAYNVIRTIRDNPKLVTGDEDARVQDTQVGIQPEGTGVQGEVRPSPVSGSNEVEADGGTREAGLDGAEAGQADQDVGGETQQEAGDSDGLTVLSQTNPVEISGLLDQILEFEIPALRSRGVNIDPVALRQNDSYTPKPDVNFRLPEGFRFDNKRSLDPNKGPQRFDEGSGVRLFSRYIFRQFEDGTDIAGVVIHAPENLHIAFSGNLPIRGNRIGVFQTERDAIQAVVRSGKAEIATKNPVPNITEEQRQSLVVQEGNFRPVVKVEELIVSRTANFQSEGTYDVEFPDGSVEQIFRDTLQFSTPRWMLVGIPETDIQATTGIGDNRTEALKTLIKRKGFDLFDGDDLATPSRDFETGVVSGLPEGYEHTQPTLSNPQTDGSPTSLAIYDSYVTKNGERVGFIEAMRGRVAAINLETGERTPFETTREAVLHIVERDMGPQTDATAQAEAAPETDIVPESQTEKIEDFGEKIGGARKDLVSEYRDQLSQEEIDIASVPLSKSFPAPNYVKMAEAGIDQEKLAAIAMRRAEIPAKPRRATKLRFWAEDVQRIKELTQQVLDGELSPADMVDDRSSRNTLPVIAQVDINNLAKAAVYRISEFKGFARQADGTRISGDKLYHIRKGNDMRRLGDAYETLEEVQAALATELEKLGTEKRTKKQSKISAYRDRRTGEVYLGWKGATGVLRLKDFDTSKEAFSYLEQNREEMEALLEEKKAQPEMRGAENRERIGKERRTGGDMANITPQMFSDAFGFRGVEFGNWVENDKRQRDLNQAYDGLMDLAETLGIPPKAVSLNGTLGLAFGARGKGGKRPAAAHYEPNKVVINLTKKAGAGSLAHEWWHALDNYFGKQRKVGFITDGDRRNRTLRSPDDDAVRLELMSKFSDIVTAINTSDLKKRSSELDKGRSNKYWSTQIEMTARAFESYVKDKLAGEGITNDYLANIASDDGSSKYPYPNAGEKEAINQTFDALFEEMQSKETDKGVTLFVKRLSGQTQSYENAKATGQLMDGTPSTSEFTLHDETNSEIFLRKFQDQFLPLKRAEQAATEFLGVKELPENMQTYVGETLSSGKIKADYDQLEANYVRPVGEILRDNNIDIDDFALYLYAKHAPERNDYIAKINPSLENGSGMSNEDADRVIKQAEADGTASAMEEGARLVYKMLGENRERMQEAGLVDDDTIDGWNARYQFYVPLKGFASSLDDNAELTSVRGLPKGFNISGKEVFSALGRESTADNPLLYALNDVENKIVRARRNEVAQRLLNLARATSERGSDQFKIYEDSASYPMDRERADGMVRNVRMDKFDMRKATRRDDGKPRFLSVKVDGNEVFVEIKNQALNNAMHNVGAENFESLVGFLGKATDGLQKFQIWRRNTLINYNPSWMLVNPIRDLQTGIMYALSESSKEGGMIEGEGITGDILANYIPAARAYYKNLRGDRVDSEFDEYFDEYQESGAPTGMTLTREIDEQKRRLANIISEGSLMSNLRKIGDLVENLNTASENAVRFAAYVSARNRGVTVQNAANLAKNMTVNFNRKGEMSAGLNLLYLFFNAAVQGTANIAQAMTGKSATGGPNKAQLAAFGIAGMAYLVTERNIIESDEDDDGESLYNDLSGYEKLMSWNIVNSDGKTYTQFPLPYGYGMFHTLGRLGAELANGLIDVDDVAAEITAAGAHHLLPPPLGFVGSIGTEDDLLDFGKRATVDLLPDIFEPFVSLGFNMNHFGSPIYIPQNPLMDSAPDSSRSKKSTEQVFKDIATGLNNIDGSEFRKGTADFSPDSLKYVYEYLTGGMGRFISRSADVAYLLSNEIVDDDPTLAEYPIIRYLNGEPSQFTDKMEYYETARSLQEIFNEAGALTGDARKEFMAEFGAQAKLEPLYKETQKQLRKLRKQKKVIEQTQSDPVRAYDQIQKIEAQMDLLFDKFNKRYREATR